MGLRDRLAGRGKAETVNAVWLTGGGRVDAVGEASYQEALGRCVGGKCEDGWDEEVTVYLRRQPSNPYDPQAVQVMVGGEHVGYLSRADAAAFQPILQNLERKRLVGACKGRVVGGWYRPMGGHNVDEGHFGIWLDLVPPS